MAIKSKIISIRETDDKVNLLVYGNSGVGKTWFAASDDRVLFVAPEDRSDGLLSAVMSGSNADKWPINQWDDLVEAYNYLHDLDEIPYNWVVIDSLTDMQEMAMRSILDAAVEENPNRDPDLPQLQDWQKYYEMVKRMVRAYNALDVNVLYTALARLAEDEEGVEHLIPDLQGKKDNYAKQVASLMTSFGCLQVKRRRVEDEEGNKKKVEIYRTITWQDTGIVSGKDRTCALAPKTENKTLKDIRLMIEEAKGGVKAPEPKVQKASSRQKARTTKEDDTQEEG